MHSLRRRLVLTLLAGLLLGGAAGAVGLYWQSMEELDELFDDRLRDIGNRLPPQALVHGRPTKVDDEDDDDIVVQLWSREGQLLSSSSGDEQPPRPSAAGLLTLHAAGEDWRSYALASPEGGLLQVAQALSARREMAAGSAARLLLPLLLILPLLAAFTTWVVARQLRPLRALAEQLQQRSPLRPSTVVVADAPRELVPVVTALNELLARQAEAAQRQQAFLADAAHALRTPLTVVGLQLQRAQQAESNDERQQALSALKGGVERATRLVAQLLALARSEPGSAVLRPAEPVNLQALLTLTLAELYPLAAAKPVDLGLLEAQACTLPGDGESLRNLIINLVDNAIRHTPAGGRVDVSLRLENSRAILTVADTGPGIAAERRNALFERFARDGRADSSGSGLGLAIARQVAVQHGGSIALDDGPEGKGLSVRVTLPVLIPR